MFRVTLKMKREAADAKGPEIERKNKRMFSAFTLTQSSSCIKTCAFQLPGSFFLSPFLPPPD